ncbi:MAG: hypothetical protein COC24_018065 [Alphaproteobacteria bacterium]|nr:hypothetical protein [Alphaproteobacteria bacterium]
MNTENLIRRNFLHSSGIVIIAFLLNAGLNVVLLGWFVRLGGFGLVGVWSFLNALLLYVLILDFGYTNALTRKVALSGPEQAIPYILKLSGLLLTASFLGLICAGGGLAFTTEVEGAFFSSDLQVGGIFAISAGVLQLLGNWGITLRLGQHEQFWFNVKSIVRVVVQSILSVVLLTKVPESPASMLGLAILLGSAVEVCLTLFLLVPFRTAFFQAKSHCVDKADLIALSKGFGASNLLERIKQPALQTLILIFGGTVGLGIFTVALRIPVVLSQSVSQAIIVLLPGLSQLKKEENRSGINNLLRDSTLLQILVVFPVCSIFLVYCDFFFLLWLGESSSQLLLSSRILTLAVMVNSIMIPYFWALQAFGDATKGAIANAVSLAIALVLGLGALLIFEGSVFGFSIAYLLSQAVLTGLVLYWSETRWQIVSASFRQISLLGTPLFLTSCAGLIVLIRLFVELSHPIAGLSIVAAGFGVPYCCALFYFYRLGYFYATDVTEKGF